jgi:hypothetical protein
MFERIRRILERIRLWRKKRKLRCPVVLQVTYSADASKSEQGDLRIEVFLGWIQPDEIESKLDAWMNEIDELDTEASRSRRRGRSV